MNETRDSRRKAIKKQSDAKEGPSFGAEVSGVDQSSRLQGKVKTNLVLAFAGVLIAGGSYTLARGVQYPSIIIASLLTIVLGIIVVLFGILPSAASTDGKKTSYKGAIAGFLGIITLLLAAFHSNNILSPNKKIQGQIRLDNSLVNEASVQLIGAQSIAVEYTVNSKQPGYFEFANTQKLADISLTLRIKLPNYEDYDYEILSTDGQSLRINIESSKLKPKASPLTQAENTHAQSRLISLSSVMYPDRYIRHKHSLGELDKITDLEIDKKDASFNLVPGLADKDCYSFESVNFKGSYLAHDKFRIHLKPIKDEGGLQEDATFCRRPGLSDNKKVSWESYNARGRYLRQREFHLWVEDDTDQNFKVDATFQIHDAVWKK